MEKEVGEAYTFTDRDGKKVEVTRESHAAKMAGNVGEAYGYFDCKASKEEIEEALPEIREYARTPSNLELSLIENPNEDENLKSIAVGASQEKSLHEEYDSLVAEMSEGILEKDSLPRYNRLLDRIRLGDEGSAKYALVAKYSEGTNHDAANEVADILNVAYQSPLYEEGERFMGEVVYKEGDEYLFRE